MSSLKKVVCRISIKIEPSVNEKQESGIKIQNATDSDVSIITVIQETAKAKGVDKKEELLSNGISNTRKYLSVAILFFINLLSFMDRFTVAGVLLSIQQFFVVNNASIGLLQTVFIISIMLAAPVYGYLGDRYNRKIIMLVGMLIWPFATFSASFITNRSYFFLFLASRALVGIGVASYTTIGATLIADLFSKSKRTRMFSIYYLAIPIGSGLGYIVGSAAADVGGSWHWALRVTPGMIYISIIPMMLIIPNPKRGTSEAAAVVPGNDRSHSSYLEDLKYVFKNRSFMWSTASYTCMIFVIGSLSIWGPVFIAYSQIVVGAIHPCTEDVCEYANVSYVFGIITCVSGFMGVSIGGEIAKKWKKKGNKNADAHVCAIALLTTGPLLYVVFHLTAINLVAGWIFIFFAELCLSFIWTLMTDITMGVTMPKRRSAAQAVQILTQHLFGDAISPYLIGLIFDVLSDSMPDTYYSKYLAIQRAMYVTLFVTVLGGGGFLMASLFLQYDKGKVEWFLLPKTKSISSKDSSSSGAPSRSNLKEDPNQN